MLISVLFCDSGDSFRLVYGWVRVCVGLCVCECVCVCESECECEGVWVVECVHVKF